MSKEELLAHLKANLTVEVSYPWKYTGHELRVEIKFADEVVCSTDFIVKECQRCDNNFSNRD